MKIKNLLPIAAFLGGFAIYVVVCVNSPENNLCDQSPFESDSAAGGKSPSQNVKNSNYVDANSHRETDYPESFAVHHAAYQESANDKTKVVNPFFQQPNSFGKTEQNFPSQLTASQVETLKSLPNACVSNLPGIEGIFEKNQLPQTSNSISWQHDQTLQVNRQTGFNDDPNMHRDQITRSVLESNFPILKNSSSDSDVPTDLQVVDRPSGHPQQSDPKTLNPVQPIRSTATSRQPNPNNDDRIRELLNDRPQQNQIAFNPHAKSTASGKTTTLPKTYPPNQDPHAGAFSRSMYPSASECRQCHEQIYDEWASSGHAYAAISPMFSKFESTINKLSQGTIGYFCLRCHAPVATTLELRRDQPIWDGPKVFREGVTCVACHRVKEAYNKSNGERRIEPGNITDPVYGGGNGLGVEQAIKYGDYYKVKTKIDDTSPGQAIHRRGIKFEQLSKSDFCMSCHQVAVQPGVKLEVVWDQYRGSPAYRDGITCQDCHMGKVPGMAEGYTVGPAAVMTGKVVNAERKHSNHIFYGPGYSIAHPGIFPQNPAADRWTVNQWLAFDWRAGWGTDDFEDKLAQGLFQCYFPPEWREADDRYDAREIIDANLKKLHYKKDLRRQVMENGSKLEGPYFAQSPGVGKKLKFHYCVTNTNPGHNMPSGSLGAQPQLWLNVVLIGPDGNRLWETGYLDSQGDLADLHSDDVLNRRMPLDNQLFNLQTKFLTTNVKGTDREMYLPINFDIDQLPFLRPAPLPVTVLNHPPFVRMESHSIPPLGSRKAKYVIPSHLIQQPGTYRLTARLRSRAEPIYFMNFVGATAEMKRMMNEWIADAHPYTATFEVK